MIATFELLDWGLMFWLGGIGKPAYYRVESITTTTKNTNPYSYTNTSAQDVRRQQACCLWFF